jgi:hypothetical protein
MHLTPAEFIDIAEGARPEASAPHLAECAACRRQLSDVRAAMAATSDVPVPEPSPLFWDHWSERIREAVAAEPPVPWWWQAWTRPSSFIAVSAAVAAVLVAIVFTARVLAPNPVGPATAMSASAEPDRDVLGDAASGVDDPSLKLVAELTADMDWEAAQDSGLATRGSAEHAVAHLSDGELRELRRLLQEELVHRGA